MEVDPAWLVQRVRAAIEQVRAGGGDHRGFGWIFLLMTPDQRDLVRRMQAAMSLLEGHANFVMDGVSRDRVPQADRFRQQLHDRRNRGGLEGAFHKAIGFDVKVRQYSQGEDFVRQAVDRVGMERFNRVWDGPESLPTMDEIAGPDGWVSRVAAG
jgi:putative hydrolase